MIDNKQDNMQEYEHLNPENFEFVQQDERIFDKKFETKPVGYFKDAMLRFSKNKTNVVATAILFVLILLAILVPMLTTKNYTSLDPKITKLPPRIPYIEKLGIFDGTRKLKAQPADLENQDPETGLYFPLGYNPDYIVDGTLKNYEQSCTDKKEICVGGETVLKLDRGAEKVILGTYNDTKEEDDGTITVTKDRSVTLMNMMGPSISVDIDEMTGKNPKLEVQVSFDEGATYQTVYTITEKGQYNITTQDIFANTTAAQAKNTQIHFMFTADKSGDQSELTFKSVEVYLNSVSYSQGTPDKEFTGYDLSVNFKLIDDENSDKNGRYDRINGVLLQTSFKYREYDAKFGPVRSTFPQSDYNKIINENADVCIASPDPEDPTNENKWVFPDACPILKAEALKDDIVVGPSGQEYYNLIVYENYLMTSGYGELPYFYFGTTAEGHDLFARVWLGLRTSLLVGVVVAIINITIGVVYGSIEGYYGGKIDLLMERFGEIIGRIPWLVWLALFVIIMGPGVLTLIILLTVTGWLGIAGITRTQFYRYKGREYVLASRTLGAKDSRLIFRHILPNGIGTIITQSILMIPGVIFTESTVSYLGYGIGHGQSFKLFGFIEFSGVSIGVLLADGRNELLNNPHLTLFPALIISILMITFNMFGNALRDAFNPSLRGSE